MLMVFTNLVDMSSRNVYEQKAVVRLVCCVPSVTFKYDLNILLIFQIYSLLISGKERQRNGQGKE